MAAAPAPETAAPPAESPAEFVPGFPTPPHPDDAKYPLLLKPTLVVLEDGRQVIGKLVGFDHDKNLIVECVTMHREFTSKVDGEKTVSTRSAVSISIPAGSIKGFYQRDEMPEHVTFPAKSKDN